MMRLLVPLALLLLVAPAASAGPLPCGDAQACKDKAMWAVRCVGDSLGGHSCHARVLAGDLAPDADALLGCVEAGARNVLRGVEPMPCPL